MSHIRREGGVGWGGGGSKILCFQCADLSKICLAFKFYIIK